MKQHDAFVLTGSMACCETPQVLQEMFRFSDLPGELRNDISRRYFGSWDAVIEYDRKGAQFKIQGLPEYSLMLANRSMHMECSSLISQSYSGKLILRDIKVYRERGFGFTSSFDVLASIGPKWLLDQTNVLVIEQGTSSMLMTLPWPRLGSLREVHLEGSGWPLAYCYPCGLSAVAKEAQEKHILEGAYDTWCMHGYNTWSLVPAPVKEGRVSVVTVREGIIKGKRLKVWVEHKADSVEVLDRSINTVIQPKMSKYATDSISKVVSCHVA